MAKKKILTDNGQEILPITHESCVLDNNGVSIGSKIGNINELATDSRTDLVSAINDILEFNNETKEQLKDVLIANGVEISKGESWESIIGKLNEKFSSGGGSLDIISATELPATGKENQICVITDNPVNQFLLSSNYNDNDSNQIVMYLGNTTSGDATKGTLLPITNGGVTTNYYFNKVMLGESRLSSYYYKDNTWTPLTLSYIPLYENGTIMNTSFSGGLQPDNNVFKIGTDYLYIKYDTSYLNGFGFLNKINFTNFSTLKITVKGDSSETNYLYIAATTTQHPTIGVNSFSTNNSIYNTSTSINNTEKTVSFNISNWTGEYYLVIAAGKKVSNTYIYNISLY